MGKQRGGPVCGSPVNGPFRAAVVVAARRTVALVLLFWRLHTAESVDLSGIPRIGRHVPFLSAASAVHSMRSSLSPSSFCLPHNPNQSTLDHHLPNQLHPAVTATCGNPRPNPFGKFAGCQGNDDVDNECMWTFNVPRPGGPGWNGEVCFAAPPPGERSPPPRPGRDPSIREPSQPPPQERRRKKPPPSPEVSPSPPPPFLPPPPPFLPPPPPEDSPGKRRKRPPPSPSGDSDDDPGLTPGRRKKRPPPPRPGRDPGISAPRQPPPPPPLLPPPPPEKDESSAPWPFCDCKKRALPPTPYRVSYQGSRDLSALRDGTARVKHCFRVDTVECSRRGLCCDMGEHGVYRVVR